MGRGGIEDFLRESSKNTPDPFSVFSTPFLSSDFERRVCPQRYVPLSTRLRT